MRVKAGGASGSGRRMESPLRLAGVLSTRPGGKVARFGKKRKKKKKGFVNDNCFLIMATNVRLCAAQWVQVSSSQCWAALSRQRLYPSIHRHRHCSSPRHPCNNYLKWSMVKNRKQRKKRNKLPFSFSGCTFLMDGCSWGATRGVRHSGCFY